MATLATKYDTRQPSNGAKGAYSAIVYIDGSTIVAEDANGRSIANGAIGANELPVIQAAIDSVPINGNLYMTGILNPQATIVINKNISIFGNAIINQNSLGSNILEFTGSKKSTVTLSGDVVAGDNTIPLIDASEVSIGDILLIQENNIWNSIDYPSDKTGEMHEVWAINGNNVVIYDRLLHDYTTELNAACDILTPVIFTLDGITFKGQSATQDYRGVAILYGKSSHIKNCKFENFGMRAIEVTNSYNIDLSYLDIQNSNYSGYGYGVSICDASAIIKIANSYLSNCRHCVTMGGYGLLGQPRDIVVEHNRIIGSSSSHAVDAHAIVESLYVMHNEIYPYSGQFALTSGAKTTIVHGNNIYGHGCGVRGSTQNTIYAVENNKMFSGAMALCDSGAGEAYSFSRAIVKGNDLFNALYYLVYLTKAPNIDICNNSTDQTENYYGIYVKDASFGSIKDNTISNSWRCGISLISCSGLEVIGNKVNNSDRYNSDGESYESGIRLTDCSNILMLLNEVCDSTPYQLYAIAEYGISNNNIIEHNVLSGWLVSPIKVVGLHTKCKCNTGYVTESTGSSIGTGSEQIIAHSLAAEPSGVSVIPYERGAEVGAFWADAKNIYITISYVFSSSSNSCG
jgi:parallel beta-helix repeat protein